jgi:hypothetical protein
MGVKRLPPALGEQVMPFREEWNTHPPCTIAELGDLEHAVYFRHNDIIYVGFLAPELVPKGQEPTYAAIARNAGKPTQFYGETVVTPLTLHRVTLL